MVVRVIANLFPRKGVTEDEVIIYFHCAQPSLHILLPSCYNKRRLKIRCLRCSYYANLIGFTPRLYHLTDGSIYKTRYYLEHLWIDNLSYADQNVTAISKGTRFVPFHSSPRSESSLPPSPPPSVRLFHLIPLLTKRPSRRLATANRWKFSTLL